MLRSAVGQRTIANVRALRGGTLWLVPALVLFGYDVLLRSRFPETHDLVSDWNAHAHFFTVFLIGFAFGEHDGIWRELKRLRYASLALALASYGALILLVVSLPAHPERTVAIKALWVVGCNQWFWLCAVLGWGAHLLNRAFRWLPYATDAIFSWYILHQTFVVVGAYLLAKLQLGPIAEPMLLILITVAACLLLHEFIIRRTPWLHPWFGMKTPRPRSNPIALAVETASPP